MTTIFDLIKTNRYAPAAENTKLLFTYDNEPVPYRGRKLPPVSAVSAKRLTLPSGMPPLNDYAVLGVSTSASKFTLRRVYRIKMMQYHPDHHPDVTPEVKHLLHMWAVALNRAFDNLCVNT